jgi:hypothetical protein
MDDSNLIGYDLIKADQQTTVNVFERLDFGDRHVLVRFMN